VTWTRPQSWPLPSSRPSPPLPTRPGRTTALRRWSLASRRGFDLATRNEIGPSSNQNLNNSQGNGNGPSLPELQAELRNLDQPDYGLHKLPFFWMTDEEFYDHLDSSRSGNDVQNEEQEPNITPVQEADSNITPISPVSRHGEEQVATMEAPCDRLDPVWVALCSANLQNTASASETSHTLPKDVNQSSMSGPSNDRPSVIRFAGQESNAKDSKRKASHFSSASPAASPSPQPGPSHSTQAAGPSKGPSNRYRGGQKRAADEDVKDLGNTKRCRKSRANKKVKISVEEGHLKALETKNKELRALESMLSEKKSRFQRAYLRMINEGRIAFTPISPPTTNPAPSTPSPNDITSYIDTFQPDEPFNNLLDVVPEFQSDDAFADIEFIIEDAQ